MVEEPMAAQRIAEAMAILKEEAMDSVPEAATDTLTEAAMAARHQAEATAARTEATDTHQRAAAVMAIQKEEVTAALKAEDTDIHQKDVPITAEHQKGEAATAALKAGISDLQAEEPHSARQKAVWKRKLRRKKLRAFRKEGFRRT